MSRATIRYRERTAWPEWADAVFWSSLLLALFPLLAGWDHDLAPSLRAPAAVGMVGSALAVRAVVRGMRVIVDDHGLLIHLGSIPLLHRRVSFDEILAVEAVRYRPIREFGGWGIRGLGKKKAWTARGDRAVRLTLTDDRQLYVGSDKPQRLAERIRTVGGERVAHV